MSDTITQYTPQYKVNESEEKLLIRIALPGVKKEDIAIKTENAQLQLEAKREHSSEENWNLISQTNEPEAYSLKLRINHKYDLSKTEASFEKNTLRLIVPVNDTRVQQLSIQ